MARGAPRQIPRPLRKVVPNRAREARTGGVEAPHAPPEAVAARGGRQQYPRIGSDPRLAGVVGHSYAPSRNLRFHPPNPHHHEPH